MQQITIGPNQAGQRLDKFLHKYFPKAQTGFLYKMLRRKNITLNGKKAEGKEMLAQGDVVGCFFAQETFEKFTGHPAQAQAAVYRQAYRELSGISVLYEDERMIAVHKPAGILTQKAEADDISLNEWLVGYLLEEGAVREDELHSFKPSVCNRLDRNTSGIVLGGKTLAGSQYVSEIIRKRDVRKFYRTICLGELSKDCVLDGYLVKKENTNKVLILPDGQQADRICTAYHPIAARNGCTLLEVELITGKTHQIRAHLASIGHPIIGDYKYGDRKNNDLLKAQYGLEYQLLHAFRMVFPDGLEIRAPYPPLFDRLAAGLKLQDDREEYK